MSRTSRYQNAVEAALRGADGPLSAAELHAVLSDTGIGIATVYRLLNQGAESGVLAEVEMPNGPTRYEPADRPHHHHFECVTCERVFDVPGCPGKMDRLVPQGFNLESHEILLRGRCADCGEGAAA